MPTEAAEEKRNACLMIFSSAINELSLFICLYFVFNLGSELVRKGQKRLSSATFPIMHFRFGGNWNFRALT